MRKILAIALFLSPAIIFGQGCSQPSRICHLVCDCEHCNDIAESYRCDQIDASQDIASIYDCSSEWDDYANCFEDEGVCDEDLASFSTRKDGSCSSSADSGIPCGDSADCDGFGYDSPTCDGGSCHYQACNDGSGEPCSENSDCSFGEDKCQSELDDLRECLVDASDDPSFTGVDFD